MNIIKATKAAMQILKEYGVNRIENPDRFGEHRVGSVPNFYRQMRFPFGIFLLLKMTKSQMSRNILEGTNQNDIDYVEKKTLPILQNTQYLKSLPKGSVGYNYYFIVKNFKLDDLYNQRFRTSEIVKNKTIESKRDRYQSNISRHVLTTHDVWHSIFSYDTNPLGEAMIQFITGHLLGYAPAKFVGFLLTLKVFLQTKDLSVWKVYKECKKNINNCNQEIGYYGATELLERDLSEIRYQYKVKCPEEYLNFIRKHKDTQIGSTIHNYKTVDEL